MKRLLRIGFDIFISSFTPIITWFFIGILINKELTNVFTLTYPMQCIMGIIISIFGVGANVSGIRDKNKNSANNGILYGTLFSIIIYGLTAIYCKYYIKFMNLDENIYLIFCIYSILQILLQTILQLILTKLHYQELNKKANKISILFNTINFISLIFTALITKNQLYISIITLSILTVFDIIIFIKNVNKIDFKFNIKNCIKYDSVSFSTSIMFFIVYLFGFSQSFSFGEKYVVAITFATLITDIQWDMATAIKEVAKIDIVKEKFDYNYHLKNATKYISLLILSIILFGLALYSLYKPDFIIVSIFVILHIIDFIMYQFFEIKITYLEIEYSPAKTTLNNIIASVIRTILSLLPTPFCTIIGQIVCAIYEFTYSSILYKKVQPSISKNQN